MGKVMIDDPLRCACERGMGGCGREQKVTEHQMNAQLPETRKAAG